MQMSSNFHIGHALSHQAEDVALDVGEPVQLVEGVVGFIQGEGDVEYRAPSCCGLHVPVPTGVLDAFRHMAVDVIGTIPSTGTIVAKFHQQVRPITVPLDPHPGDGVILETDQNQKTDDLSCSLGHGDRKSAPTLGRWYEVKHQHLMLDQVRQLIFELPKRQSYWLDPIH
ncbi:hypothetical protein CDES_14510 (plasmid) [Corynebacterium deserti GIMN1.010]|uniref:Uncharacterized protein n=1 Tax=Corynebacterium deserti GIMN1.010 TaxID=931089 RepID=A0A0M3QAF3_9CORY|nr:hypothetical protein CDES_14510 [Corynebacterium deserti GIMN1.010]